MSNIDKLLGDFKINKEIIEKYSLTLEHILTELLTTNNIRVHSVSSRIKKEDSLREKIERKPGKYSSVWDITDLSGIRIITVFEDDVDKVGSIIENEFLVDEINSIDKRKLLDPDRFGYLSLHYIVSLSNQRWKLSEYNQFRGLKAEIQVRSLLQHAWAGIVHDLGYKSKDSIPKIVWRKFYRLSGLLELADQEFINVREQLKYYKENLHISIIEQPETVGIDAVSLRTYINSGEQVYNMDNAIIDIFSPGSFGRSSIPKNYENIEVFINIFKSLNLNSIEDINVKLKEKEKIIFNFAEIWLRNNNTKLVQAGRSLEYLIYILLLEKYEKEAVIDFFIRFSLFSRKKLDSLVEDLFDVYSKITTT